MNQRGWATASEIFTERRRARDLGAISPMAIRKKELTRNPTTNAAVLRVSTDSTPAAAKTGSRSSLNRGSTSAPIPRPHRVMPNWDVLR